ncbi:MAG: hypothetical protein EOM22_07295, partial [Gammaproteobacteria bacterium]|nr:hypothetical protein [Gammaproteobacteria bacterium]
MFEDPARCRSAANQRTTTAGAGHRVPVVRAAETHKRLVTIHPFLDGNGRTARLVMCLGLLTEGYCIANIPGDTDSRRAYYDA